MSAYEDAELQAKLEDEVALLRIRREAKRIVDTEERPPAEVPPGLTLRERLALPRNPVRWRVDGWLPVGGRVVFAAQAKAGKTTAVANLVRSLVDGTPWLGRDPVHQVGGRVAVLDFEMTETQLTDWYQAQGVVNDDRVVLYGLRGHAGAFDLRDEDRSAEWAELLQQDDIEVVVWDCLRPVMDALGLDEHHDAGLLLTGFDGLLAKAGGPEAVVVHHMGHNNERARGDSRIVGWGDANWKLVRNEGDGDDGPRWISAYGRDVDQPETQLARDVHTGRLIAVGGTRAAAKVTAAYEQVEQILREADEPLKKTEVESLAAFRQIPRQAARDALAGMVAINQVLVETGDRGAQLHRWNPSAQVSLPVRGSLPIGAGELPRQSAAAFMGGRVARSAESPLNEPRQSAVSFGGSLGQVQP